LALAHAEILPLVAGGSETHRIVRVGRREIL
jgi:hypothetical protein